MVELGIVGYSTEMEDIPHYPSIVYSARTLGGHIFFGRSFNFTVVPCMSTASTTDMDSTNDASYASINDKPLGDE